MKTFKKVLASTLAAAMVVTALPVTSANAAAAPKLSTTKAAVYVGQSKTIKVTTPKTWKSVKVKATTSKKSVAKVKASKKKVTVKAVKAGTAKVTVKVTGKKSGKAVKKTLKATITVKNPALSVSAASEVAVGSTEAIKATVKPANTKVTYTTSDEKIATVDAKGVVTGVAAGDVTITVKAGKTTKTVKMAVKKAILKSATQTEANKIEAVIVGDTKDLKAGDFKVTNTATNATVAVKTVTAKKNVADTFVIETFGEMTDAKDYSVEYAGTAVKFTATDGAVAKVGITTKEIPAASATEVKATTLDKNGVVLKYFGIDEGNTSKGYATSEVKFAKGYQDGSKLYLPAVGDTATVKVTYHTGTFGTDGKETGNIEDTFTVTAVDPSLVNLTYAVTVDNADATHSTAPAWEANSFKANNQVKIGDVRTAYVRITKEDGSDIDNYSDYKVEGSDKTKLLVADTTLTAGNATQIAVNGVAEGTTYILVKKDDKTVASLPLTVVGKPVATTLDLNKTSATVAKTVSTVTESVTATIKDQYGDSMSTDSAKVTVLGTPNKDAKFNNTTVKAGDDVTVGFSTSDNKTFTFDGSKFDTKGTYTFKISSKNGDKTLDRTFTVNVVDKPANGVAQSYEVKVDNAEIDTTINKNGDKPSNITVNVAQMANGAAFDTVDAQYVKYVVKKGTDTIFETSGKTSAAINDGSNAAADLTIAAVSQNGVKYDKLLSAGTYNVTATFYVKTTSTGSTFSASDATDYKKVTVGGSFVIKDTQDSKVTFTIENNNLSTTVASAFENQSYVKVYYDGQLQTIASGDVIEVKGTSLTNGGAYVTTVKLYVTVSGSNTVKVPVTVTVNDQFKNCTGLK